MTTAAGALSARVRRTVPEWTFADRLRKIRVDVVEMHQAEFAEKLGVTKSAYSAWESGRTAPRNILAVARLIESISGVPAIWTLGIDGPNNDGDPAPGANLGDRDIPLNRGCSGIARLRLSGAAA